MLQGISNKVLLRSTIIHLPTVKGFMGIVQLVPLNVGLMMHSQTQRRFLGLGNTAVNGVCIHLLYGSRIVTDT